MTNPYDWVTENHLLKKKRDLEELQTDPRAATSANSFSWITKGNMTMEFAKGTQQILKAIAESKGFTVIGGGHLAVLAKEEKLEKSIGYISTGGGATMAMLAGQKLPGVEALYRAAKRAREK